MTYTRLLPMLALVALLFSACKKPAFTADQQLTIGLTECRQASGGSEPPQLCFASILQDSRCPINAECVWQGVAVVRLNITLNNKPHTVDLATADVLGFHNETTIDNYHFQLMDVQPYPGGTAQEQPSVTVRIQR